MCSIYYHLPISDHVYSVIKQQIWGLSVKYRMNNVAVYSSSSQSCCCCCCSSGRFCRPHAQHVQWLQKTARNAYYFKFSSKKKYEFMNFDESFLSLPFSLQHQKITHPPFLSLFWIILFISQHMHAWSF